MKNKNYELIQKMLFDADEKQPLTLTDGCGATIEFEQIFVRQCGEELFCILRPLAYIEELPSHAALVFSVDKEGVFRAVREKPLSDEIFAEYYKALQKAERKE